MVLRSGGKGDDVDFVVVGFGLGAVMMLVGMALRDLGPWLFGSGDPQQSLPEFETVKETIRKQTLASIGAGIATAGAGLAAVTFAALLAKIDDDLGTIVVGMSLALAAVGVGAWTYDSIRRYRAAMDVVLAQEESVMARIAPVPKRERSAIPQPATAVGAVETPAAPDGSDFIDLDEGFEDPQPDEAVSSLEGTEVTEGESNSAPEAIEEPAEEPAAIDEEAEDPELEIAASDEEPEPREPEPPAFATTRSWLRNNSPDRETPGYASDSRPEPDPPQWESGPARIPSRPTQTTYRLNDDDGFTELPPLPEEGTDTLIEEAVRFDTRPSTERNVPSWLFDDLETDLATPGQPKPDDGIDQFRGSQAIQRRSALDRILAGDDGSGDDSDESEPDTAGDSTTPDRSRKPN